MSTTKAAERLPANHRLVYDVVRALKPGDHAPAGEIYTRARELKTSLGYSTVYRALDRLCRVGLVFEVHVPGSSAALYEQARPRHGHLVCKSCGRVEDVDCEIPAEGLRSAIEASGGEMHDVALTVHGHCSRCHGPVAATVTSI